MSRYLIRPLKESDIEAIIAIDALVTGSGGPDRAGFWRGLLSLGTLTPEEETASHEGAPLVAPREPASRGGRRPAAPGGQPVLEGGDPAWEGRPLAPHLCEVAELAGPEGGRVVGFIIGDVQSWQFGIPRHGRIVTIGVHPDHRREGMASELAGALLKSFTKIGLPFVHCLARPGDTLGEFFRSIGFKRSEFEILEKPLH